MEVQHLKDEATNMMKNIELLEDSKRFYIYIYVAYIICIPHFFFIYDHDLIHRKLLGEGLGSCTIEDLQNIEQQLQCSVSSVRARKV